MVDMHLSQEIHSSTQAMGQVSMKSALPMFTAKLQSQRRLANGTVASQFEKPDRLDFRNGPRWCYSLNGVVS
jgi:hypothetical protein